jgi:hypothetical protein
MASKKIQTPEQKQARKERRDAKKKLLPFENRSNKHLEQHTLQELLDKNLIGSFCVVRYNFEGEGLNATIVIRSVKAMDHNGKYIKFVHLKEVINILHEWPVAWKQKV